MSCKYKRIDCAQFVCPVAAQKLSCHVLTLNGDSNPSSFCPNKTSRNLDRMHHNFAVRGLLLNSRFLSSIN